MFLKFVFRQDVYDAINTVFLPGMNVIFEKHFVVEVLPELHTTRVHFRKRITGIFID